MQPDGKLVAAGNSTQSNRQYYSLARYFIGRLVPLHLLTFTAHLSEQRTVNSEQKAIVNLRWTAENEINFDRYEIERSINGREFSKAGTVRAANSRAYSFDDNISGLSSVVGGRLYYRLKMIDKDGSFTYSKVEQVQLPIVNLQLSIALFSNPVKDKLQINIESDKKTTLQGQVIAPDGRVMLATTWNVAEGSAVKTINTSALQSGSYFLRITRGSKEQRVVKFSVINK